MGVKHTLIAGILQILCTGLLSQTPEAWKPALEAHQSGDYRRAIYLYTQLIAEGDQGYEYLFLNRGECYHQIDSVERALEDYTSLLKFHPDLVTVWYNRAAIWRQIGEYRQALNDLRTALDLGPEGPEALNAIFYHRGMTYYAMDDCHRAIPDLAEAVWLIPRDTEARSYLANCLAREGRMGAAVRQLDTCISIEPRDFRMWYQRAVLRLANEDPEGGLSDLSQALQLRPDWVEALIRRGSLSADLGRYEQALADYNRAIELTGGDLAGLYYLRGLAFEGTGNRAEACADFARAVQGLQRSDPLHSDAQRRLLELCE